MINNTIQKSNGFVNEKDKENIKQRIDIKEYLAKRTGIKSTREGLYECPFCHGHDCLRIDENKQAYNCFQCEAGGDVIRFVEKFDNCEFVEAVKILADDCGYQLELEKADKKTVTKKPILEKAASYYHNNFLSNSFAIKHQTETRKHDLETLKVFQVGYTDGNLHKYLQKEGFTDGEMIRSGLVTTDKNGNLRDYFIRNLFIYPHRNVSGYIGHFTIKDIPKPKKKKISYQLKNDFKLEGCQFYNMKALKEKSFMLVEGENDLLSVYESGYKNVAAMIGKISQKQIDELFYHSVGKTIYIAVDNDKSGQEYIDKISKSLGKLSFTPTLSKLTRTLHTQIKIIHFDKQHKDIDNYLKAQENPLVAMENLITTATTHLPPLIDQIIKYYGYLNDENACDENDQKIKCLENDKKKNKPNYSTLGTITFEWFQENGCFYVDNEKCYMYYNKEKYEIGSNTKFQALMFDLGGHVFNAAERSFKVSLEALKSLAYKHGVQTVIKGFLHSDTVKSEVYYPLCNEENEILKLSPNKIEIYNNGINPENVLLKASPKALPMNFIHDADVKEGMKELKRLVLDNLACSISNRFMLVCNLVICLPLIDYIKAKGLYQFIGTPGCGKTSGGEFLTALVYGQSMTSTSSVAALFAEASTSPFIFEDNLENDKITVKEIRDALLTISTGIKNQKRDINTSSGNIYEDANAFMAVSSVEPFTITELISRTIQIEFDKDKYANPEHKTATITTDEIRCNRDLIMSASLKLVAHHILPNIKNKIKDAVKFITDTFPNHSKARLEELYPMLYIALKEITKYIEHDEYKNDPVKKDRQAEFIFTDWIKTQNLKTEETESGTNDVVYRLEALLRKYLACYNEDRRDDLIDYAVDEFKKEYSIYGIERVSDAQGETLEVTFFMSSSDFCYACDVLSRSQSLSNTFKRPQILINRIKSSMKALKSAGWTFEKYEQGKTGKKIHGERKHSFTKSLQ